MTNFVNAHAQLSKSKSNGLVSGFVLDTFACLEGEGDEVSPVVAKSVVSGATDATSAAGDLRLVAFFTLSLGCSNSKSCKKSNCLFF